MTEASISRSKFDACPFFGDETDDNQTQPNHDTGHPKFGEQKDEIDADRAKRCSTCLGGALLGLFSNMASLTV